jgi:hypothetical protein
MRKEYRKVTVKADLEVVVYCDEEDIEDAVADRLDEGEMEIYGWQITDDEVVYEDDYSKDESVIEYMKELKHE